MKLSGMAVISLSRVVRRIRSAAAEGIWSAPTPCSNIRLLIVCQSRRRSKLENGRGRYLLRPVTARRPVVRNRQAIR